MKTGTLRRLQFGGAAAVIAALAVTTVQLPAISLAADGDGNGVNNGAYQTMPALPTTSRCFDSSPKQDGTNAPLPGDPNGYGFANESILGWEGNYYAPFTYLSGSYFARGVPTHYASGKTTYCGAMYSFGVYNYGLVNGAAPAAQSVKWTEADGYLPAMTTSFSRNGVDISLTNFADKQNVNGTSTELVYTRVTIHNTTSGALSVPPGASGPNLVTLQSSPDLVAAGATVTDDYVAAVDTFGVTQALPDTTALAHVDPYDAAFHHMAGFWKNRVSVAPVLSLPNTTLPSTDLSNPGTAISNAYKAAFIYTRIVQTGMAQFSGANNYDAILNHDVPSILDNRFAIGDFKDAQNLLLTARISEQPGFFANGANWYWDGLWKTPTTWADYLRGTNDTAFVSKYFHDDANGPSQWGPSLFTMFHTYYLQQLDPATGYLKSSIDNDTQGTWLFDDESALAGLASYGYIAGRLGNTAEQQWASQQYTSLLNATNAGITKTEQAAGTSSLPCSVNTTQDRCNTANDANWAGSNLWSQNVWDIYRAGGTLTGLLADATQTDNVYTMGFGRLTGSGVPFPSFGAYPGYSVALNTGYSAAGLYGSQYRDLALTSYAWQLQNTTGGPNAWWEANSSAPDPKNPWIGSHAAPQFGAVPYAWPLASQTQTIQQALVTQSQIPDANAGGGSHTALLIGRGIPDTWVANNQMIAVSNLTGSFDTASSKRQTYGVSVSTKGTESSRVVRVSVDGAVPSSDIHAQLPVFTETGVKSVTGGSWNAKTGDVTFNAGSRSVQVTLGASVKPTLTVKAASQASGTPQPIFGAGVANAVTATIANTGKSTITFSSALTAPANWTATTDASTGTIDPGKSATITWNVTPATGASGKFGLPITVTYASDNGATGTLSSDPFVVVQPPLPLPTGSTDLAPTATPSASYTSPWEHVNAINDGIIPSSSNDQSGTTRWGTWPNAGNQWIELDWSSPITADGSAVYFFQDNSGVFTPTSWVVQYWDGSNWVNVSSPSAYGTATNTFNQVSFDSVTTTKLRVQMQSTRPVGVYQWVVDSTPAK